MMMGQPGSNGGEITNNKGAVTSEQEPSTVRTAGEPVDFVDTVPLRDVEEGTETGEAVLGNASADQTAPFSANQITSSAALDASVAQNIPTLTEKWTPTNQGGQNGVETNATPSQYEQWALEKIQSGYLSQEGVDTLTKEIEFRKGDSGAAQSFKEPGQLEGEVNQVADTPKTPDTKENGPKARALERLAKLKAGKEAFTKNLRERMGLAQEKMEAISAKVAKGMDAYNKLEPKTKLAVGLGLTAVSMIGVASGATFLAGSIGILRLGLKGASTKAMYDGLEGMLDKKYAEMGDVSETRKKVGKIGALTTAILVNFAASTAITNALDTDVARAAFDKIKNFKPSSLIPAFTGAVATTDVMGNVTGYGEGLPDTPPVSEDGWDKVTEVPKGTEGSEFVPGASATTPSGVPGPVAAEAGQGKEIWPSERPDTPSQAKVTLPTEKPAAPNGKWVETTGGSPNASEVGVEQKASPTKTLRPSTLRPSGAPSGWDNNVGVARPAMAMSTPSVASVAQPAFGFDAASAPPVGSTEVYNTRGELQGFKLPDGSFLNQDGTTAAAAAPADSLAEKVTGAQPMTPPTVTLDTVTPAAVEPVAVTETPKAPTVQPDAWRTSDGSALVSSDGQQVQSGFSAPVEAPSNVSSPVEVPKVEPATLNTAPAPSVGQELRPVATLDVRVPESVTTVTAGTPGIDAQVNAPASPSAPIAPSVTPEITQAVQSAPIAPAQPFTMSFAPNPGAPMSPVDIQQLSTLNALAQSPKFDSDLMDIARKVARDKASLPLFVGEKDALLVKNNFTTLLKNNPSMTFGNLLDANVSSLTNSQASAVKEARGVLTKMFSFNALANPDMRKSSIVTVLQNNFK